MVILRRSARRKAMGWSFIGLGVIGTVLPFVQGFLFLAVGLYVLRDQHIWAARRWQWAARRWPQHVASVEALEVRVAARFSSWGQAIRRRIGR